MKSVTPTRLRTAAPRERTLTQLQPRDRRVASVLWRGGPASRSALHRSTGIHPNLVGITAQRLIDAGVLREADPIAAGRGRPSAALEVDPDSRHVVGISIAPGAVESTRLTLLGEPIGKIHRTRVRKAADIVRAGLDAIDALVDPRTLTLGVATTGLIDLTRRVLLFSSAMPDTRDISLQPLFDRAGTRPLVLDNDQHAQAASWMMSNRADPGEDVLLVTIADGRLGASILPGGPPNRGCVLAGNELGHTRLPVETPRCYCGHTGCLERICSTAYARQLGATRDLVDIVASPGPDMRRLSTIIDQLAFGLANAVNLVRPHRVVLMSPLFTSERFCADVCSAIRRLLLPALAERVRIETSADAPTDPIAAAWLGLAWIFHPTWSGTAFSDAEA